MPAIHAYCEECGRHAYYTGRRNPKRYFTQWCIQCHNDRRFYLGEAPALMPIQDELDGTACSACGHKFKKNEGRYAVNGATCMACYESKDITVRIGGHEIPQKLLNEYAEAVEAVRRGVIIAVTRQNDPLVLMKREQNRVAAHKRIFEAAGIPYGDQHWEDNEFQTELAKWLDANALDPSKGGAA